MIFFPTPQAKYPQPRIDLSESVLLPLLRTAIPKRIRFFDEAANTSWPESVRAIEFSGNESISRYAACMIEQRTTFLGENLRTSGIVPDAVIDVVGVLLFVSSLNRMPLHS